MGYMKFPPLALFVFNKVKWVAFFSYVLLTYFFQVLQYAISGMIALKTRKNTPELMNDGIWWELIVCALHPYARASGRYGSGVNLLGIARGQSHSNFMLY